MACAIRFVEIFLVLILVVMEIFRKFEKTHNKENDQVLILVVMEIFRKRRIYCIFLSPFIV